MEISGEYQIANDRETVWAALNDVDVLRKCIPGCESLEKISDTQLNAIVTASIGPVKAKFNTRISLQDLNPPESYTLVGESKSGVAGFGRGSAKVALVKHDAGTILRYEADFKVGGKLAQVGSRLVLGATRKMANDFFSTFAGVLDPAAVRLDLEMPTAARSTKSRTYVAVGIAGLVLLIWWFLLR